VGQFEYEVTVFDEKTGKRKLPEFASGSYLYLAVSEPGVMPEGMEAYRRQEFSSTARHILHLASSDLAKQANLFARYANRHGKEGPAGPVETFLIS
jgi:hypothetical protein